MAKPTVKKCDCGRVTNPVTINIVNDAWVKNSVASFQFDCPQCKKQNIVKMIWDETIKLGTNRVLSRSGHAQMTR